MVLPGSSGKLLFKNLTQSSRKACPCSMELSATHLSSFKYSLL